jgi:PAS domain-containing protein
MTLLAQSEFGNPQPLRESSLDAIGARPDVVEAEALLLQLASVFVAPEGVSSPVGRSALAAEGHESNVEAKYRALLEQIPAVVFMAYVDRGVSEAYVSPEIEAALGYSREEWLEDPVRWYEHIIPTINSAGVWKPPACFSQASRSAPPTACWRGTAAWSGSTAMRGWCGNRTVNRGLFTAWPSIFRI